jgi:hypothetical protein
MIAQEKPDIVCIATRPATHAEITVFAAEKWRQGCLLPNVPRESSTVMGIKDIAEALDIGHETQGRFNLPAAVRKC